MTLVFGDPFMSACIYQKRYQEANLMTFSTAIKTNELLKYVATWINYTNNIVESKNILAKIICVM